MRHFSIIGIAAFVLSTPLLAAAGPMFYAMGENGTIYSVAANGATSTFVTGMNGFCIACDAAGNVYVNNAAWTISKITPGPVSTYATGVNIHGPDGLAFDGSGNLYNTNVADGTAAITPPGGGVASVFATGMSDPNSLAFDSSGNLYVSSTGLPEAQVYKITSGGVLGNFATGSPLSNGLVFGSSGDLYVAGGDTISQITSGGVVSTVATESGYHFGGLAIDSSGDFYATTQYDTMVEITPGGNLSTFATLPTGVWDLAVAVPEPASMVLLGSVAGCLLLRRSRVRR